MTVRQPALAVAVTDAAAAYAGHVVFHARAVALRISAGTAVSQAALEHTTAPTVALHAPASAGAWPAMTGIAIGFPSFDAQAWFCVSQNCAAEQSPSTRHPPAGSRRPETEHAPDRQRVDDVAAEQGPSPLA